MNKKKHLQTHTEIIIINIVILYRLCEKLAVVDKVLRSCIHRRCRRTPTTTALNDAF